MRPTLPRWLLGCVLATACAGAAPTTRQPPTTAPPTADAAPAPDAAATAPPAPVFSVAEVLPEGRGLIFAERPGAAVTLHPAQGPDIALADGEAVTFFDDSTGVGQGDSTAVVEARGVRGAVPNARVVTEARLRRSPDGRAAVFSAIATCGDLCHVEVWLLGPEGARSRITADAGPDVVVAWSPDSARVAVGSGGLHVVTVADGRVADVADVTAPAWAPDGALFARGAGADDGVFAVTDGAPPRRLFGAPGRPPAPAEGEATPDPTPVTIERDGRVLRAEFRRGARTVTVRAGRDGRPAPALSPQAAAAEAFAREQVVACNAERARLHEDAVFPGGTTVTALRPAPPRGFVTRFERPGVGSVEVVVDVGARQIRHPRGASVALGGGLDFCPPAVWLGPHND